MKKLTVVLLSLMIILMNFGIYGSEVKAEEDYGARQVIDFGEDGGVKWILYKDGELDVKVTGDPATNPGYDTGTGKYGDWPWTKHEDKITSAKVSGSGLTTTERMFNQLKKMESVDLTELDTSNVTTMSEMFSVCWKLKKIEFGSGFKTSKVTKMYRMFGSCNKLEEIDLSGFDTKNVETMYSMFYGCSTLEELDVTGFDTSKVSTMGYMFSNCKNVKTLDVSGFDTSNVSLYMTGMFYDCANVNYLDLSSFDMSKVFGAEQMFEGCNNLKRIKTPKALPSKEDVSIELPRCYVNSKNRGRYFIIDTNDMYKLPDVNVWKVELDRSNLEIMKGDTAELHATITPSNATCQYVIWSSSDDNIATVDSNGKVTGVGKGEAIITATSEEGELTAKCNVKVNSDDPDDPDDPTAETVVMYRLYNPNSGEHFYTGNAKEIEDVVAAGWKNEGFAWEAPIISKTPVYRLYNPNAGDHHYTMSASEKNSLISVGWKDEGIGWYSDDGKNLPLQRLYNPNAIAGAHHYTISVKEKNDLIKAGWKYEGIAWYALPLRE